MWTEKLQEIVKEKKIYGEKVNNGATEEEIIKKSKEVIEELLSFIYSAAENNEAIYVEYE